MNTDKAIRAIFIAAVAGLGLNALTRSVSLHPSEENSGSVTVSMTPRMPTKGEIIILSILAMFAIVHRERVRKARLYQQEVSEGQDARYQEYMDSELRKKLMDSIDRNNKRNKDEQESLKSLMDDVEKKKKGSDRLRIPVEPDKNKVRFTDVAAVDDAKYELMEIVEFLKDPEKFKKLGAKCPKGALLIGPPGTGKTLLAKAVAGEAGVPFFSVSGSEFDEEFVGVGAARVRELFAAAKARGRAIIFVDEIDAVGEGRGRGASYKGGGQTLNQFLVETDGFEDSDVILIGATNRPDILDEALLRPGRFDRQVTVGLPDVEGRLAILKVHTKDKPLVEGVELRKIALQTPGFSGAELANLANEAAIFAGRRAADQISLDDFDRAIDKVKMGPEGQMTTDLEKMALVAYHEAGHALAVLHEPDADPLYKATIVPRRRTGGFVALSPREKGLNGTLGQMEAMIRVAVAGRVAERLIFGEKNITTGASGDISVSTKIAFDMIADFGMSGHGMINLRMFEKDPQTAEKIVAFISQKATEAEAYMTKVLTQNIEQLHTLAEALMEHKTLTADQIGQLVTIKRVEDPYLDKMAPGMGLRIKAALSG